MSKAGTGTSAAGTGTSVATDVGTRVAGKAAFEAQIADLTAASLEATARSIQLRTVTTNLNTIKKAADERVQ
ncbi:nodulation protein NopA [Mesorhizobium sp. 113-1-2]|nr:nodulation protein NopA [Mesorhizobium loti]BBD36409.1 nodulation protein NopA [Aminobacter sp. SS-2016]BCG75905.1 nodulation protein NopA [Mesorhizobium sp. 113-1-2]BCG82675.1 nodulation protein NopA [Mesorhizobium sp. 113-3-3]BCG90552.1 nodulation protein NopA [Mesorhizobium sp. 113-3-9]BCG97152.1 nodulation protein NopA [Mesorhizobium sp. 131-2-1]BCH04224.1 nodulation protein NopA [Mesorhizobium sp. 131-2-5]BCH18954.1 nodulation protein NopA [Mesorhizobium sp. L-2-11]BCH26806.1 nodula